MEVLLLEDEEQRARPGAGRPYWANWIETAVPSGHRRVSVSPSQAARWIVLKVPDSRAGHNIDTNNNRQSINEKQ